MRTGVLTRVVKPAPQTPMWLSRTTHWLEVLTLVSAALWAVEGQARENKYANRSPSSIVGSPELKSRVAHEPLPSLRASLELSKGLLVPRLSDTAVHINLGRSASDPIINSRYTLFNPPIRF